MAAKKAAPKKEAAPKAEKAPQPVSPSPNIFEAKFKVETRTERNARPGVQAVLYSLEDPPEHHLDLNLIDTAISDQLTQNRIVTVTIS